jgi:class 3 adenylate cyclase
MALIDDLKNDVNKIFRDSWSTSEKTVVPDPSNLGLGNDIGHFEGATILYADLNGSTSMVDTKNWYFSAEVYKTYLHCAAKIIRFEGGTITAYDGDRIMAVFVGDYKNTAAVRCAMKINYAVLFIVNPAMTSQYPQTEFTVKHSIGIDTSEIRVARIGVKGDNDLVWVGRAANYAAKLTTLPEYPIWITSDVFDRMNGEVKNHNGASMWEQRLWTAMNKMVIYRSNWYWPV